MNTQRIRPGPGRGWRHRLGHRLVVAGLCAALGAAALAQGGEPAPALPVLPAEAVAPVAAPPASAPTPATADAEAALRADSRQFIVVAVDNPLQAVPRRAGSSLRAYAAPERYGVGSRAATVLAALQQEHQLTAVAAWPISALGVQCVVMGLPPGTPREALLQRLAADPRVRLAQPLQDFEVLTLPPSPAAAATPGAVAETDAPHYNDPYVTLQRGFVDTAAARAHRLSTGQAVDIAIVDTGADTGHPDLSGRVSEQRDLVGAGAPFDTDRHGTEVAGIIGAAANNGQGIVGMAPQARLRLYRACWYPAAGPARCNSFTLAKALAAVLEGPARIVNLSLGGPADPLLEALVQQLQRQQRIVVSALPASGRREGFPAGLPGVLVAGLAGTPLPPGVLPAPGRDVLTLTPGGRYDYSSGSSLAAAHVSGITALLLAADPRLDLTSLPSLLAEPAAGSTPINAEQALQRLARRPKHWAGTR